MTLEEFHDIMDNPFDLSQKETDSVKQLTEKHPYFQTARILALYGIKANQSENYNSYLKTAASYSTDRTLQFDYINHKQILEEGIQQEIKKTQLNTNFSKSELNTPVEFDKNDFHSFSEWLKISTIPIDNTIKPNSKLSSIDRFIELNPKLSPLKNRQENIDIALSSITENQNLMTETLARVYVEQKKYNKAIQAFRILSLKYPEKSGFFADQINAIKKIDKK